MEKVNDSVRLVEERVVRLVDNRFTEIQVASQINIQKVNTEIKNLREQLSARELTNGVIPSRVLPVMAVDVENSSKSISELATSAGNYHMGNGNANNCTTSVCGNATSQPSVNSISRSAIVNVASDVFANNPPTNEITLPIFHDSLKQIVLPFLRNFDEYYKIRNVPESLKLRAVTDPVAKSWFSTVVQ
jgi:hypothetical protein